VALGGARWSWTHQLSVPLARRREVAAIGSLGLLAILIFHKLIFERGVLYDRDIHLYWLPQVTAFVRSVARGSWPVWDPHLGFGQPMLAAPNTQILYPPTWLHLLLSPWLQHTLSSVGHLWFAGAGLYLLGRRVGISHAGSFTSAAILVGSGPLLSLCSMHHFASACWMPWVWLAAEASFATRRLRHGLLLGGALAIQLLAGSPDVTFFTGWIVAARGLCVVDWRGMWGRENARLLAVSGAALCLALGLSAAQWLPTLDVGARSERWDLPAAARDYWSLPPLALLQIALPVLYKDVPLAVAGRPLSEEFQSPLLHSVYLGLPALGLACAAAADPGRGRRRFLVAVLAFSVLAALGRYFALHSLLVGLVPFAGSLRHPMKLMILAASAFALLCGIGLDALARREPASGRIALVFTALAAPAGALALLMWLSPESFEPWLAVSGEHVVLTLAPAARSLARASAACLAIVLLFRVRLERRLQCGLAGALAVADLVAFNRDVNPTADRAFYELRPPALSVLQRAGDWPPRLYVFDYLRLRNAGREQPDMAPLVPPDWKPSLARAVSLQLYLYPPAASRWDLYGSYDRDLLGLQPPPLPQLTTRLRAVEGTPSFAKLLRIAAVDYVVALHDPGQALVQVGQFPGLFRDPIRVFRVPEPLPRAYVVGGVRVARGAEALRALEDPTFDPTTTVVLEAASPADAAGFAGRCRLRELRPDRIVLQVEANRPGVVVLTDAYDGGWRALLDGVGVPLERANAAFRAVAVPAGQHVVEMEYRPRSVIAGLWVSAASAVLGLFGVARWQAPRAPRARDRLSSET
jgi:hypothetical protein